MVKPILGLSLVFSLATSVNFVVAIVFSLATGIDAVLFGSAMSSGDSVWVAGSASPTVVTVLGFSSALLWVGGLFGGAWGGTGLVKPMLDPTVLFSLATGGDFVGAVLFSLALSSWGGMGWSCLVGLALGGHCNWAGLDKSVPVLT